MIRSHGSGGDEEPEYPDGPLVRIGAPCCLKHGVLRAASDDRKPFAQRLARMSSAGDQCHLAEVRLNRQGGTPHDRKRQVRVSPGAATVDQPGLRG